jgi:sec-independent protein translocase protein TatB
MGTPPPIELGSLGMADSLILMVLALVVFGPRRLPQIGRQIGKLMFEFRKASNDFKFQMEEELRLAEDAERRKKEEEKRKQLAQESVSATPAIVSAIESPYLGEGVDPPDSNVKVSEAARSEEAAPRILPPATGEPVAAARSSELAELTVPAVDSSSAAEPSGLAEPPDRGRAAESSNGASATPTSAASETASRPQDENSAAAEVVRPNG